MRKSRPHAHPLPHLLALVAVLAACSLCGFVGADDAAPDAGADSGEVYELRTYTTAEGRLPALHARFRDHTMKLFEKHGMRNVMYWTPLDEPNTLIYVVAHKSRAAADASWDAFVNDPEWKRAHAESVADGKIVTNVDRVFMKKTDFSP
ncbi:MAG: NIPSNAP family protein [Planctomycetales bacterium]|nr:NIPSNAP family protein [Planctomycetales bacterium]